MNCWWPPAYKLKAYSPSVQGPAAHRPKLGLKRCAVLVPLVDTNTHSSFAADPVNLLIIRRCSHLRRNPGEYAFPGGMFESIDNLDPYKCALREWNEEMGDSKPAEILGQLDDFHTLSGLSVTPIVAWFSEPPKLFLSQTEVNDAFYIPLRCFDQQHLRKDVIKRRGKEFESDVYYWNSKRIWGITAGIIRNLITVIAT